MDSRVAGLALATTTVAVIDTLAPTPEDMFPILGWVDEFTCWGLSMKFWGDYFKGKQLEEFV